MIGLPFHCTGHIARQWPEASLQHIVAFDLAPHGKNGTKMPFLGRISTYFVPKSGNFGVNASPYICLIELVGFTF
jgi:hypothetical protein